MTLAYPYAKRVVSMPQAVLGVAFSFGIPMAFAAAQGGSDWTCGRSPPPCRRWPGGCWLGNLFWVLAYDTEYAMVDRDDDLRIGIRTSAITLGRFDVAGVMAFYAIYLLSWLCRACAGPGAACSRSASSSAAAAGRLALDADLRPHAATAASARSAPTTGWARRCSRAWCCRSWRRRALRRPRARGLTDALAPNSSPSSARARCAARSAATIAGFTPAASIGA